MGSKISSILMSLFVLVSCCCATVRPQVDEEAVRDMLESTVQIEVEVAASVKIGDQELSVTESWAGSGVVYEKTSGLVAPIESKILTANHVLEAPSVGDEIDTPVGKAHVDAVLMVVRTRRGLTCELEPLVLGVSDTRDVATGLAHCDAGRVAPIAKARPADGATVFVSGHPLGVPVAVVTDGLVSGWMDGYLLISAAAAPGNSGGPVWYNGEVIGLLVRGAPRYPHISLVTPLKSVLERIEQTP